jgi:C1A family cysteine protease
MKRRRKKMKNLWIVLALLLALVGVSYSAEIDEVQRAIAEQGAEWIAEENEISSLPPEQRQMRLGALPYVPTEEEMQQPAPPTSVPVPSHLDWRNYTGGTLAIPTGNYVSAIKNQGNCGSCWAFSVTGTLESRGMIDYALPGANLNLSEQIVLSCSGAGSCNGGYTTTASQFLLNSGTGKEGCYPYCAHNGNCANACSNYQDQVLKYQINSYSTSPSYPDVDTLKGLIASYGPVSACFEVFGDFYSYSGGVYHHVWGGRNYACGSYGCGHAIVIVGYKDVPTNPKIGGGYFIVKNSWGPNWGEAGFFRIAYSEVTGDCQLGRWASNPTITFSGALPFKLRVTSPSKGEQITSGNPSYPINWEAYSYSPGIFKILYTLDGGVTWKLIANNISGSSTYNWPVPIVKKNKSCKIKIIESYNGKNVTSAVSGAFTILK